MKISGLLEVASYFVAASVKSSVNFYEFLLLNKIAPNLFEWKISPIVLSSKGFMSGL